MRPGSKFTERIEDQQKARAAKAALVQKLKSREPHPPGASQSPVAPPSAPVAATEAKETALSIAAKASYPHFGTAQVPILRDGEDKPSTASASLAWLVDRYLEAAATRKRQIALLWPSSPKSLVLVHALATLERWTEGDKLGARGLIYPVKTNVFYPLNHLRFVREPLLKLALAFAETSPNPRVRRSCKTKDAYLSAFNSARKDLTDPRSSNPTLGELLPHYLASASQPTWTTCESRLLSQLCSKLQRRSQAVALRVNCAVIGSPSTAPDAMFALDGRMKTTELKAALVELKRVGAPEVVIVNATRNVRRESRSWKGAIARFCLQLESVFGDKCPGVLVVADEPHAAYRLREELETQNAKRAAAERWREGQAYAIVAMPCAAKTDGLMPVDAIETRVPAPREIDTQIVDAQAAKIVGRLNKVANASEGGREAAKPVTDAIAYINRVAALPCGLRDVSEWLATTEADDRMRSRWAWPSVYAPLVAFSRSGAAGEPKILIPAIESASKLLLNCEEATPFAHLLASQVDQAARGTRHVMVVMASNLHRLLAERFLARYADFAAGRSYAEFGSRVRFVSTSQLDEALSTLGRAELVFAGLDDESLRLLVTDDRIPSHCKLLLTQQNGQYLRAAIKPLVERFESFKPLKPRLESMLRVLSQLPEDPGLLTNADLVLPAFRLELSRETSERDDSERDPEAWTVLLEGTQLHWRPNHRVYVYDPASREATERGFRPCEVRSLTAGDRLFVMSADLRDLVEGIFKDAGIALDTDKAFETALRNYHSQVSRLLEQAYPSGGLIAKVRQLRASILDAHPKWKDEFPEEQSVRHWVNLGHAAQTAFEELRPQAPQKEAFFRAFAQAIGMSDFEAAANWQRVILPIRNARRQDGRHLSEIYTHMLLQPETARVHSKMSRQTVQMLYERARESLCVVQDVVPNSEEALRA